MGQASWHLLRAVVVAALAAPVTFLPAAAPASCGSPEAQLSHGFVHPGREVVLRGEGWVDGCDDTGGGPTGCGRRPDTIEPSEPKTDIDVSLWPQRRGPHAVNHKSIAEWTVDGPEFTVRIPTQGLKPGDYRVDVGHYEVLKFRVATRN